MKRSTNNVPHAGLLFFVCLLLLTTSSTGASASPSFPWESQNSVANALLLPDGQSVQCQDVEVARIAARNNPAYFIIRDAISHQNATLPDHVVVLCRAPLALRVGSGVDISGVMGSLPGGERCILNPVVYGHVDQSGNLMPWSPLFGLSASGNTVALELPTTPIPPSDPSLPNDGTGIPGAVSVDAVPQGAAFNSVADLVAASPAPLSLVALTCKPVTEVGDGYIVVGDDTGSASVKVYTSKQIKPTDRIVKLSGTIHTENGSLVIYADSGPTPYFDPQGLAGQVFTAGVGTVAYAGTLSDTGSASTSQPMNTATSTSGPTAAGTNEMRSTVQSEMTGTMSVTPSSGGNGSWVYLTGQVVTATGSFYSYDLGSQNYQQNPWIPVYNVQGVDRTPGIRVLGPSSQGPHVACVVDIMAQLNTIDGERTLGTYAGGGLNSSSVECKVLDSSNNTLVPRPLALSNKALGGTSLGNNPGIVLCTTDPQQNPAGLYNIGTYVTVYGKIVEQGDYYFDAYHSTTYARIDDGSGVVSGNSSYGGPYGNKGVIVFGSQDLVFEDPGTYVSVTGPSSVWKPQNSTDTYRAIWTPTAVQDWSYVPYTSTSPISTISGSVTLYDMTTDSAQVTVWCSSGGAGGLQTVTVQRGANNIGTASYTLTGVHTRMPNGQNATYIVSAKCDNYKTRTCSGVAPGATRNFYLVPLRKIYLSTDGNRSTMTCSLNVIATVRDSNHSPVVYPAAGGTVRFWTNGGSFSPTGPQQTTTTANTDANGNAAVTLYTVGTTGPATVEASDDLSTPWPGSSGFPADDAYQCDWEALPQITINPPVGGVSVGVTASPSTITYGGWSLSAVNAQVVVCAGAPPVGTLVNFSVGASAPCVFVDSSGNQLGRSTTAATDGYGNATVWVAGNANQTGTATVTASATVYGVPASGTTPVAVAAYSTMTVTVSANPSTLTGAGTSAIVFTAVNSSGQPVHNLGLNIYTTTGTLSPSSGWTTNVSGRVNVTLTLNSPASAYVSAIYTDPSLGQCLVGTTITCPAVPWQTVPEEWSCPLVAHLTGGMLPDVGIIGADGLIHIWSNPSGTAWIPASAGDFGGFNDFGQYYNGDNTLSAGDIDGDGELEFAAPSGDSTSASDRICAFGYDPAGGHFAQLAGWYQSSNHGATVLDELNQACVAISDVNLDGSREVVAGDSYGCAWGFNGVGTCLWEDEAYLVDAGTYGSSVATGDIKGDGKVEAVVGSVIGLNSYGLCSFSGDLWGTYSGVCTSGWPLGTMQQAESSPAIGDLDGDGVNDIAVGVGTGSTAGGIYLYLSNSGVPVWRHCDLGCSMLSSPAIADLAGDGKREAIVGGTNGRVYALRSDGTALPGWETGILLHSGYAIQSSPAVADVIDGVAPEVIIGCDDGNLYAIYADGRNHASGPIAGVWCCRSTASSTARVLSSPTVDDIDNDGNADIVVGSEDGLWWFKTAVHFDRTSTYRYPWPTFHHDNARTGCIAPLPAQRYGSVVGRVTAGGVPQLSASVYIYFQSDTGASTVPVPLGPNGQSQGNRNSPVSTCGQATTDINSGGYSINQLQLGQTYKIKVVITGRSDTWIQNITLNANGVTRADVAL